MSEFTCYNCKMTFKKINDKNWNDFKAAEEFLTLYQEAKNDPTDILCDDCNKEFREWFSNLTNEFKEKMRNDFYKDKK